MKYKKILFLIGGGTVIIAAAIILIIVTHQKKTYQWDGSLKGYLQNGSVFSYAGLKKNEKYSDVISGKNILYDKRGSNDKVLAYSVTVEEPNLKFNDFLTGKVIEEYFFNTNDDVFIGASLNFVAYDQSNWNEFNEIVYQYFKDNFSNYKMSEESSGHEEDGEKVRGRQIYEDVSGNQLTIEYGKEVSVFLKYSK